MLISMAKKGYIFKLEKYDGCYIIGHTNEGRMKRLIDLWHRFRFFRYVLPDEYSLHKRPFRFIKSLRASITRACIFDMNVRQVKASGSGPTARVGNEGESDVSPLRCDTST